MKTIHNFSNRITASKLSFLVLFLCIFLLLSACSKDPVEPEADPTPEPTPTPTVTPTPTPTPYPECDYETVRPYEVGQIMIVMYHGIVEGEPPSSYQRNVDDFRQDLQDLYDRDFRTIPISDLINNDIKTLPGYVPVVITFDDALSSTFSLVDEGGTLVPKPGTAIAIMEEFYKENPDFGKHASLYIHGKETDFDGDGTLADRLKWLVQNGYELGNHTYDHAYLNNITSSEELQRQLALTDKAITDAVPGYKPIGIAYPYGLRPDEALRDFLRAGSYDGHSYSYRFALCVGDVGTPTAPNRNLFNPFMLPRVRGSNDEETDLGWKLFEQYPVNPEMRYVSDGNPNRIAVPNMYSHNVDPGSLGDKELYYYD